MFYGNGNLANKSWPSKLTTTRVHAKKSTNLHNYSTCQQFALINNSYLKVCNFD